MDATVLGGAITYKLMYKPSTAILYVLTALYDVKADDLPRFCNAWIEWENKKIRLVILARIGKKYHNQKTVLGQNADQTVYMNHPNFIEFKDGYNGHYNGNTFFDDGFGRYYFDVPAEWEPDFHKLLSGNKYDQLSPDFKNKMAHLYPNLIDTTRKLKVKIETEEEIHKNHPEINEDQIKALLGIK